MPSFSELIRSQEELLKRLLLVSQRQLEIVQTGDGTLLLEHLGKRQQLWNELELLDQQLAPHKTTLPESRVWKYSEERQMTEEALNRCKELMAQILENDAQSMGLAEKLMDEIKEQLQRVQHGGRIASAYGRQSQL